MFSIDPITPCPLASLHLPDSGHVVRALPWSIVASVNENLPGFASDVFRNLLKWFADGFRRACDGLTDVNAPLVICRIGNINANTGEPTGLILRPCPAAPEAQPPTRGEHPLLSVDIEPLVGCPALWASSALVCLLGREAVTMWQNKPPDANNTSWSPDGCFGVPNRGGMAFEERVPCGYRVPIQRNGDASGITVDEPMKHHSQMG